jgi:ribosomal protein L15
MAASKRRGIKILAKGVLTKKLSVVGCVVSAKAKEAILAVGGSVA